MSEGLEVSPKETLTSHSYRETCCLRHCDCLWDCKGGGRRREDITMRGSDARNCFLRAGLASEGWSAPDRSSVERD